MVNGQSVLSDGKKEEEVFYPVGVTRCGCQDFASPPVPDADRVLGVQTHRHQTLQGRTEEELITGFKGEKEKKKILLGLFKI